MTARPARTPAARIGRPKGTGSQRVYEAIRERILKLQMTPGAVVDESSLVAEFGVSRTPVREALIGLAKDGYVTLLPNRGATVSPLDIEEIPEFLESLELCLRVTTRWAAIRRTDADLQAMRAHHRAWNEAAERDDYPAMSEANNEFHLAIALAAGNRHITKLYQSILPQYYRLSLAMLMKAKFAWPDYKSYFRETQDDHEELIRSIESHNADLADRLALRHAKNVGQRLVIYIQNFSAEGLSLAKRALKRLEKGRFVWPPIVDGAMTSSERITRQIEQLELQLEELETGEAEDIARAEASEPAILIAMRAKPKRKPLPDHLPRQEVVHQPAGGGACICPACGGGMGQLGEDVTEVLDYVPGRFQVIRHIRPKYACNACDAISQAPAPAMPTARGRATPATLAHLLVSKYCDHLPLYRQSEIYARDGLDLDRSTAVAEVCLAGERDAFL